MALDPVGRVVPALAERWIVTDDGMSYIFRLRQSQWRDGEEITAEDIRTLLRDTMVALRGTSLGLDLSKIEEIRAMTGRVVEIRLSSPMPEFLQLLAQPEMGLVKGDGETGPMTSSRDDERPLVRLTALPPEQRGMPPLEDWEDSAKDITVEAMPAPRALQAFSRGQIDLVLNGRLATFPQVELGPLSRGTIQLDPAQGLFGFLVKNDDGLLADPGRREALSMAINRAELLQGFAIDGWVPTDWVAPAQFFTEFPIEEGRWPSLSFEERLSIARERISRWRSAPGRDVTGDGPARISVLMPDGPGSDLLFEKLAQDWRAIGVSVYRVEVGESADLELVDRLARYSSPRWYLNQFHCSLKQGLCSPDADEIVEQSLSVTGLMAKERMLARAQAALMADEVYIPLGAPVRWSLARGSVSGYSSNQWGIHPLFPLSQPPI